MGMFAFAVYDAHERALTLVRDRYGIKPLYHSTEGAHFLFASELKALAIPRDGLRVDRHSLLEWSLYRNVDALTPETLVPTFVAQNKPPKVIEPLMRLTAATWTQEPCRFDHLFDSGSHFVHLFQQPAMLATRPVAQPGQQAGGERSEQHLFCCGSK